jgi:hypothetical protein
MSSVPGTPSSATILREFAARLRILTEGREDLRPFVCHGDPYACTAFVIGFNPASTMPEPFWRYWDDAQGFNKAAWLNAYRCSRSEAGKRPLSNTRQRLDWISEGALPVRILETNLHAVASSRKVNLQPEDRRGGDLVNFLLGEIKPRAVLLNGKDARTAFVRRYGCALDETFTPIAIDQGRRMMVAAVRHLAIGWSREAAIRMGNRLGEACR